ncbi:MAG: prephenate dehydrogenase [Nitrospirales bacterium]|nr:prephenate dehydrogenase/arogenate dehydrogenase family protein [Nitrospirales bacterium]
MTPFSHTPLFQQVTIIGVGLLGGSLGLALKQLGLAKTVIGVGRSRANLELAMNMEAIDAFVGDAKEVVGQSDFVVLATPVDTYLEHVKHWGECLRSHTVVSDVGSVKGPLVLQLESQLPPEVFFVGAHPIAGKEKSGVAYAEAGLFKGARCIVTPTSRTRPEALKTVCALWEAVGSTVISMNPHDHDWVLGAVSHLPHVAAFSLMQALCSLQKDDKTHSMNLLSFSGGGLRDTTRIAASSPEMWRDICLANRDNLLQMIDQYVGHLQEFKKTLQVNDAQRLQQLLEESKSLRERLT